MSSQSQRGSAIIMLFIAVALFGMLAFAFMQGSRSGLGWVDKERSNAATTGSLDCSNAVNLAVKRLEARGCGAMISYNTDGTNSAAGAPTDGSCSVYHINGGGVKNCGAIATPGPSVDPCTTGTIGTVCTSDGAIYIGDISGDRIYLRGTDESGGSSVKYVFSATPGTSSLNDGEANTNAMILATGHPAAELCRSIGPEWYLPAINELQLVWTNRAAINLTAIGIDTSGAYYWSSTQTSLNTQYNDTIRFDTGVPDIRGKAWVLRVRCARK